MLRPKLFEKMVCGLCLFCMKTGLSYWCDEKEQFTGQYSPACEDFVPTVEAAKEYQRMYGSKDEQ